MAMRYGDLYSAVHHVNLAFTQAVALHPGLSRCFNQYAAADQKFVRMWEASAIQWARDFAHTLADMPAVVANAQPDVFLEVYTLLGCSDSMLCQVYIERDPQWAFLASQPERLAEDLAVLWYRGLAGTDPAPERLAFQ